MTMKIAQVGNLVRAPKTAELIARRLRRRIVQGELETGSALPSEVELMEQFGVSRPTLREAFRILEAENLITVRRGARGGAQVTAPDAAVAARYVGVLLQMQGTTIEDVYEARMVSEPECAAMLARRRTKQDLADLRVCVDELEEAVVSGPQATLGPDAWSHLTFRFHELLLERCRNQTLAVQGAVLHDIVTTHHFAGVSEGFGLDESAEEFKRAIRSYRKLIKLVDQRDAEGAKKHWRTHMENAAKALSRNVPKDRRVVDLFD